ncbi:GNAT family N-acetyltransferase [Parasalinivibrio latis]|uniref:GNAT family N-acetyltransferase n=1 Tax=Parasalinivibrio latis TaxID=2952610 RepID=UPI0030DFEB73
MDCRQPVLNSQRLTLRPFTLADAGKVADLAGDWRIADTTEAVPHPYSHDLAEQWIISHLPAWLRREEVIFGVFNRFEAGQLIGAIGVHGIQHSRGELGYWIGVPYWGNGYATEAAKSVTHFCFEKLGLTEIFARHLERNPASGRVLQKNGFTELDEIPAIWKLMEEREATRYYRIRR